MKTKNKACKRNDSTNFIIEPLSPKRYDVSSHGNRNNREIELGHRGTCSGSRENFAHNMDSATLKRKGLFVADITSGVDVKRCRHTPSEVRFVPGCVAQKGPLPLYSSLGSASLPNMSIDAPLLLSHERLPERAQDSDVLKIPNSSATIQSSGRRIAGADASPLATLKRKSTCLNQQRVPGINKRARPSGGKHMPTENEVMGNGVNGVINVTEIPQTFRIGQQQNEATQDTLLRDQRSPERGQRDLLTVGNNFTVSPNVPLILDFEVGAVRPQPDYSPPVHRAQPVVNRNPSPYVERPAGLATAAAQYSDVPASENSSATYFHFGFIASDQVSIPWLSHCGITCLYTIIFNFASFASYACPPVEYKQFGPCSCVCRHCGAMFWEEEKLTTSTRVSGPLFHRCCLQGRVKIFVPREYPAFIRQLFSDRHFLENIRAYNQMIARDKLQEHDVPEFKVRLFSVGKASQYELPTADAIGAIVFDDTAETEPDFDIVLESHSGDAQRINKLHSIYMPTQFPLLFVYGEHGYHTDLRFLNVEGVSTRRGKRMTMKAFYDEMKHIEHLNYIPPLGVLSKLFEEVILWSVWMKSDGPLTAR
ncbi:hypothetical protein CTI12_AA057920 [Artemisia annua]|uniref:Helitron helicase-like domain-containing protein n=1 Tax=Artemisia annua TaxID=35608 RepID=A0A2U1Q9H1_ARTAN|nr:hypothetical protein CTI12_AA057920 [Artemisia annua]